MNALRGVFAFSVLACHLSTRLGLFEDSFLRISFVMLGYLSVSVFFFISGYGLAYQSNKKETYLHMFLKNRLIPFYVSYLFTVFIYTAFFFAIGEFPTVKDIIQSCIYGKTVVTFGWYFQVQLLLYVLFYACFRFCGKYRNWVLLMSLISLACATGIIMGLPTTWYESIFAFYTGIIWSEFRNTADCLIRSSSKRMSWVIRTAFLGILFVICVALSMYAGMKPLRILFKIVSSVLFPVVVCSLVARVKISFRVLDIMGKYSLQIYALQGIGFSLFRSELIYIKDKWLCAMAIVLLTASLCLLFKPVYDTLDRSVRKKLIQNVK